MQLTLGPAWFRELSSIGYVGVSFFFVLSGFILVYTCQGRSVNPVKFWRTRFARIYPAYIFSLLLMAPWFFYAATKLKFPLFAWATGHLKSATILVVALLQAWVPGNALAWNSVCWSLSVESFFYLLFPLLLFVFARRSRGRLLLYVAISWLIGMAVPFIYLWLKPDGLANTNPEIINAFWLNALQFDPMARLPEFLMGMSCGFLFLRARQNDKFAISLIGTGVAGFILVVRCGYWIPFPVLHTALLAPAFAAIVYGVALRPRFMQFLENKTRLEHLDDRLDAVPRQVDRQILPALFQPEALHQHEKTRDVVRVQVRNEDAVNRVVMQPAGLVAPADGIAAVH